MQLQVVDDNYLDRLERELHKAIEFPGITDPDEIVHVVGHDDDIAWCGVSVAGDAWVEDDENAPLNWCRECLRIEEEHFQLLFCGECGY